MHKIYYVFLAILIFFVSCQEKSDKPFHQSKRSDFNPESYQLKDMDIKLVKGQILYMPVYSNMPRFKDSAKSDMSAFVAFHNTDFKYKVRLQKVQYFDSKGKMVHDFLEDEKKFVGPLETCNFTVPYYDQGGTGANFLIEWMADTAVSEPLVESITLSLKNYNSVSILSNGKVIKELK